MRARRHLARRPATGACIFSVLVHFKHVHVYAAPAIAAHLLAHRVGARWSDATRSRRARLVVAGRCARYLAVAVLVTAVSLGPFAREGVLGAVFSRLFPFGRGLSHAYWAPNVWALYNAADKVIAAAARRAPARRRSPALGNLAGGMSGHGGTGAQTHAALPTVTPALTFALTLASCLPFIARHVAATSGEATRSSESPRLVARTTTCAFAFGWHVHEKALLMATTPLAVALALDAGDETVGPAAFARDQPGSIFSLDDGALRATPLLFEPREWPVKACVVARSSRRDRRERGVSRRRATEDARIGTTRRGGGTAICGDDRPAGAEPAACVVVARSSRTGRISSCGSCRLLEASSSAATSPSSDEAGWSFFRWR